MGAVTAGVPVGHADHLAHVRLHRGQRVAAEQARVEVRLEIEPGELADHAPVIERWKIRSPGGLVGQTIAIDGLATTMTDVLVRLQWSGGATETVRLDAAGVCTVTWVAESRERM